MTGELKKQFGLRIAQANKTELIVILYDMILAYVEEGKEAHKNADRAGFREAVRKIRGCSQELIASLNFDYEPAGNLLSLYLYINRELVHADIHNDVTCLDVVSRIVKELREAYAVLAEKDDSLPVMENTQTVYVGLTYGRDNLNENLAGDEENRGFFA